jgi:hypothetical protein
MRDARPPDFSRGAHHAAGVAQGVVMKTRCPYCRTTFSAPMGSCSFCGRSFSPFWSTNQRVLIIQILIAVGLIMGVVLLALHDYGAIA